MTKSRLLDHIRQSMTKTREGILSYWLRSEFALGGTPGGGDDDNETDLWDWSQV